MSTFKSLIKIIVFLFLFQGSAWAIDNTFEELDEASQVQWQDLIRLMLPAGHPLDEVYIASGEVLSDAVNGAIFDGHNLSPGGAIRYSNVTQRRTIYANPFTGLIILITNQDSEDETKTNLVLLAAVPLGSINSENESIRQGVTQLRNSIEVLDVTYPPGEMNSWANRLFKYVEANIAIEKKGSVQEMTAVLDSMLKNFVNEASATNQVNSLSSNARICEEWLQRQ